MQCTVGSLDQMGLVVCRLLGYVHSAHRLNEEHRYYLRVVLNELITNGFKHGGGCSNAVRVDVNMEDGTVEIVVDDGGRGICSDQLRRRSDAISESGRGLAIVMGLCQSVELNDCGNRITARLALQ